jgi:hypothetical protein
MPAARSILAAAGTAAVLAAWAAAAPGDAVTDPAMAGPDFEIQGEYAGRLGDQPLGAQVIALGGGTFRAVFLTGGLPGDGWDGKTRIRVEGRTVGELTLFEGGGWSGRIGAGRFVGEALGGTRFSLRKTTRQSPTLGEKPPERAVVLFGGNGVDEWEGGRMTADGLLEPGSRTRRRFRDFTLHLEFRTPFKPEARGQSRGNSGVYLLGQYEIQVLDSFGLDGLQNECGALYRQRAPDVNMCYPPLSWQTYDVDFEAPRFDETGRKVKNAVITVRHNGVPVHSRVELTGPTGGAQRRAESGGPGTINIQNHGNPVHLRNIWVLEKQ